MEGGVPPVAPPTAARDERRARSPIVSALSFPRVEARVTALPATGSNPGSNLSALSGTGRHSGHAATLNGTLLCLDPSGWGPGGRRFKSCLPDRSESPANAGLSSFSGVAAPAKGNKRGTNSAPTASTRGPIFFRRLWRAMKRPRGTGHLYVKWGRYYGRWRTADGQLLNRSIGKVRAARSADGLTRAQAERALQRLIEAEATPPGEGGSRAAANRRRPAGRAP